ncbi:MAG: isoprenyl transferase [Culturomica sp.]|jgi:undecaprenyl diphosphate synthase|nr:isoprenyl transferase [Culturomica sp.]
MDTKKESVMPKHVAIIMDGNGRWAKERGKERIYGHQYGVEAVRNTLKAAQEIGLEYLTLYTFSIENWNRPKEEVDALMELMVDAIVRETGDLMRNGVRVKMIGNQADLPEKVAVRLNELIRQTENNPGVTLVLALSYGARWEILEAARRLAADFRNGRLAAPEEFSEELFSNYLSTAGIPDPDLLIRTSGERRLSNFLLWQCAYTEFYFIDKFWPDFGKDDLYLAIHDFQQRERRFGKTGEQLK